MTTSAMFHSDLSISVNERIATLPQTVTHSSGEAHTHTHTQFLIMSGWMPLNGNAVDAQVHTHTVYVVFYSCVGAKS